MDVSVTFVFMSVSHLTFSELTCQGKLDVPGIWYLNAHRNFLTVRLKRINVEFEKYAP